MNERIQELLQETYTHFGQGKYRTNELVAEKFAELIVRECADIANRQFSAATGLDDRDCLTAHQMKQHFGVEE